MTSTLPLILLAFAGGALFVGRDETALADFLVARWPPLELGAGAAEDEAMAAATFNAVDVDVFVGARSAVG